MDERQRAFWDQASSDHAMFRLLSEHDQPVCHKLHFLQMCAEKLAKAYFFGTLTPPDLDSHAVIVKFLRAIASGSEIRKAFGIDPRRAFKAHVESMLPLAEALERLAPALAGDGPNPEYPWPRHNPVIAPVNHSFALWQMLQTPKGRRFLQFLDQLLNTFSAWA